MADDNRSLHIVVFPWLVFGHMLPFLELSRALARKGHRISFISTPRNMQRLPKLPSQLSNLVDFIPLHLPPTNGLRDGAEATADLPLEEVPYLKKALDSLEQPFRRFIEQTSPKPDWIIQDFIQHWIAEIGAEAGVPTIHLSICSTGFYVFDGPPAEFAPEPSRRTPEELTVPRAAMDPFPFEPLLPFTRSTKAFQRQLYFERIGHFDPTPKGSSSCWMAARRWLFGAAWN